jgi:tetratricopeptide (TPR) repeat protein
MALADYWFQQQTLAGTSKAARLEPDSAAYHVRLAALLQDIDAPASRQALERAVALNPWDSQSWVELGLRDEAAGDLVGAERNLLQAARIDKQYFPNWSLMNYYFRRGDAVKFWFSTRQAVAMAYGDLTPLFNLCWKVSSDGALIARELDIRNADTEAKYLTYLTRQNRIEAMTRAAARLLGWNREADGPILLTTCDRLIANNRSDGAIPIWNKLAELHRIPFEALAPRLGRSLTNGDFTTLPASLGFDWRLPGTAGVMASLEERPPALRISFSGRQPESCEMLTQFLPVLENSTYELRFLYRTTGIAVGTGLGWRISDRTGARILAQSESLASQDEREGSLPFNTTARTGLVHLTLGYLRTLGTTRIEGSIILRKLRLMPARKM